MKSVKHCSFANRNVERQKSEAKDLSSKNAAEGEKFLATIKKNKAL